jgi:hypothetical protein
MPCFPVIGNNKLICSTVNNNQMYASFIPVADEGENMILIKRAFSKSNTFSTAKKPMSEAELCFAYFSLYILFPLLYNMLVSGNQSVVMKIWRYITSGVFDTVQYMRDIATDIFYAALRMTGQYAFSTYTVVKDGREIYSASSLFYYYKSDVNSVYRIDRAKYNVCKWIDSQCRLFSKIHGIEPEVNETHNNIYDFILHKVDDQPYTRIHRGNFTGRTHTLITQHYRPYKNSYQFASEADLTVYIKSNTVEPPLVGGCDDITKVSSTSTETDSENDANTCFPPLKVTINLKSPHNFFLEKNEFLDTNFLKWKLYNDYGRDGIAKYLRSLFYSYKVNMYYNECMKDYFKDTISANEKIAKLDDPDVLHTQNPKFHAYSLNEQQSVMVGHTYLVKVDSVLRCPVFESNEKQVFDIDGVLSTYYNCSDSDETETDSDNDTHTETDTDTDTETETDADAGNNTADNEGKDQCAPETPSSDGQKTSNLESDDPEFELIQEQ